MNRTLRDVLARRRRFRALDAFLDRLAAERGALDTPADEADIARFMCLLAGPTGAAYRTPSRSLDLRPGVDIDKALRLSNEIEDAEIVRKLKIRM